MLWVTNRCGQQSPADLKTGLSRQGCGQRPQVAEEFERPAVTLGKCPVGKRSRSGEDSLDARHLCLLGDAEARLVCAQTGVTRDDMW